MEHQENPSRGKNIWQKAWGIYYGLAEKTGLVDKKVPAQEIDEQAVAKVIADRLLQERTRLTDFSKQPFFTSDVLNRLGYATISGDYWRNFPQQYRQVQQQLREMARVGILQVVQDVPNRYQEVIKFKVIDEDSLKQLANTPQRGLPAKP